MRDHFKRFFPGRNSRVTTPEFANWAVWAEQNPNLLSGWFDEADRVVADLTAEICHTGAVQMGIGAEMPSDEQDFKDPGARRMPQDVLNERAADRAKQRAKSPGTIAGYESMLAVERRKIERRRMEAEAFVRSLIIDRRKPRSDKVKPRPSLVAKLRGHTQGLRDLSDTDPQEPDQS
jgi:hypothetical protein